MVGLGLGLGLDTGFWVAVNARKGKLGLLLWLKPSRDTSYHVLSWPRCHCH